MQHRFRRLLQKNLLMLTLPGVLVLASLLLLLGQVSRLEHFQTEHLPDTKDARDFFLAGQRNVEVQLDDLRSTGFIYKSGDSEEGEYFYRIDDDAMEIVLLKKKTAAQLITGKRDNNTYLVRLIKDDVTAGYIEQQYAEALGMSKAEFSGLVSSYIFDEVAYPRLRILLLQIVMVGLAVILGFLLLYVILATAFPVLNHEAQVLRRYGKVGRYIRKLDREMDSKLKMHQDNVIVTENFLIVSYLSHIDVVRIDDIKYLSKHVEKRRRRMGRPITVYRFTASNGEDLYFEADFFDEGVINDVIYYMRGEPLLEYEEMSEQERAQEEAMMQDAIAEERSREAEADLEKELFEQFDRDELDGLR